MLAELALEAGLPEGVLNIVHGAHVCFNPCFIEVLFLGCFLLYVLSKSTQDSFVNILFHHGYLILSQKCVCVRVFFMNY